LSWKLPQVTRHPRDKQVGRFLHMSYDIYKIIFNLCDILNRKLNYRTWPHKHGGRNVMGEWKHKDNSVFSSILLNCFNSFMEIAGFLQCIVYDYKEMCCFLSRSNHSLDRTGIMI
jgi:hypothetical protein